MVNRLFIHIWKGAFALQRHLSKQDRIKIESAIADAETKTSAEIAFAVEERFSFLQLFHRLIARQRAEELFSSMRVWDTEANNGVLLYLLLSERNIEIVADRGVMKCIKEVDLEIVCQEIEKAIRKADVCSGVLKGIEKLSELLAPHFPPSDRKSNQVSNKATVA